ncbi:hypothetical protein [Novosphingobium beihaiensis]|uniref:Uncharacterized protein n=1 Tax=Novosphingobium beihaiensis TaxID=2930389 RepID=A0ABT0BR73_9SPHN|nr:hypothetical protein [Novosphingobium beihaiensis]MCJ2187552.1 hypothetical protein [Novosphingobium beihaiensis]
MLKHADAILKLSLAAGALLAGSGAGFYYGIYLPSQDVRRQAMAMTARKVTSDRQTKALAERAKRAQAAQIAYDDCVNFADLSYKHRWTRSCQSLHDADVAAYEDCADDWFTTESSCHAKHPVRPTKDCALPGRVAQDIAGDREQRKAQCLATLQAATEDKQDS